LGSININNSGAAFDQRGTLSASNIDIFNTASLSVGTINARNGTVGLSGFSPGPVTETGTITANSLTVYSAGGAILNGANRVNTLRLTDTASGPVSFTNAQSLTIQSISSGDLNLTTTGTGADLTIGGGINAGGGNLLLTSAGRITVQDSLTLSAGKNTVLASNGAFTASGLHVDSPAFVIDTTGRPGGAPQLLNDLLSASAPGATSVTDPHVITNSRFTPAGSTRNPIDFGTGGVDAPNAVTLLLADAGAITGTTNVAALGVSGVYGSANLIGWVARHGDNGDSSAPASQVPINPFPQSDYLFNGCAIGSAVCTLPPRFTDTGFDRTFYLLHNPDVLAAGVDPYQHYLTFGWREGRDPDQLFSTSGYLAANPDVGAAGVNPLLHYYQSGWMEGRDPSPGFDTQYYLIHAPDVASARIDPLVHYLEYGSREGRLTLPAAGPPPQINPFDFDPKYYLLAYPDVAAAGLDPYQHFLTYGWHEGRNPNGLFNTSYYLANNPDVASAGVNPLLHYDQNGWQEGRNPSALFSTTGYLSANPDVAAAHVDPLDHFLIYGLYEGRLP
jgi:hypothetical protein